MSACLSAVEVGREAADKFIVLSEFQVWADAASPEVFKELNKRYLEKGRSHVFNLCPQEIVRKKVNFVSLAGVNFGYSRYNYDLFLEVIRPHLALAPDVATLRKSLQRDEITGSITKADVAKWLSELKKEN